MNAIDGKNTLVAGFLCALIAAPQIVNADGVRYGKYTVGTTGAVASDTNVEVTDADTYNAVVGGLAIEVKRDDWGGDKIVSEGTSEANENSVIVKGGKGVVEKYPLVVEGDQRSFL